jgi:hypothetical protein
MKEEVEQAIDAEPKQCVCWKWRQETHKCFMDLEDKENWTEEEKKDGRIAKEVEKEVLELNCLRFRWS